MNELLVPYTRHNKPATEEEVQNFIAAVGFKLPADYLALMQSCNGAYGEAAHPAFLFSFEDCLERTRTSEGLPPNLIVFASDGGSVEYLFDGRGKSVQILELGVNDDVSDARKLGASLGKAMAKLRAEQQKAEEKFLKRSKLPALPILQPGQPGEVARLALHSEPFTVCDVAFSEDSSHVAISGNFGIQVWSVNPWRRIASVLDAEGELTAMGKVHLDLPNHRLISFHRDKLLITDYMARKQIDCWQLPQSSFHSSFLDSGRKLIQHSNGNFLTLTDLVTRKEISRESVQVSIRRLSESWLLGQPPDSQMVIWDATNGKRLYEFLRSDERGQIRDVNQCCAISDGRIFEGGYGGEGHIIDLESKITTPVSIEGLRDQPVHFVERVAKTKRILIASSNAIHLVDSENWGIIATFDTFQPGFAPERLWTSPDGRWLLTTGARSLSYVQLAVRVWRLPV